ncbi:MAG: cytochrome c biogenesis protein CcsA [Verrucomicrobia bacterium]|nr:cytochrome c biogenesis protein CcsA [Verrucomicrobiota bacterium]
MSDRDFIFYSLWVYVGAFLYSLYLIQGRGRWESRGHTALVAIGWLLHGYGLCLRAQAINHCPITNLFEVVMFITWAVVLVYLMMGLVWRVSLLGEFTLPLVIACVASGLIPAFDHHRAEDMVRNVWLSLHAAIALLSYGALALAGVTGAMYLVQERQLKAHRMRGIFARLPAIEQLDRINYRLLVVGFAFLTVGIVFGFVVGAALMMKDTPKTIWSLVVWALYGGLLAARMTNRLRGRKVALGSIVALAFVLATFWGVNMLSAQHRF